MTTNETPETFDQFKNSFSYGSRTDLSFKFLKGLSEEAAADFFQQLLWKLSAAFDQGEMDDLMEHVIQAQIVAYAGPSSWVYDDGPFTPLQKPLSQSRLALLTTSNHYVEGHDPEPLGVKNMSQEEAAARINEFLKIAPTLNKIPTDTPNEQLRTVHGGYDVRGAQTDPNVAFPLERLREFVAEGVIGELAAETYSFSGACAQTPLLRKTGPQWVAQLQTAEVEAALLVPV